MEILNYLDADSSHSNELIENTGPSIFFLIEQKHYKKVPQWCKYCKSKMDLRKYKPMEGGQCNSSLEVLFVCSNCGWWYYMNHEEIIMDDGDALENIRNDYGILKKYKVDSFHTPTDILRDELIKKPNLIYNINDKKMEQIVGSVFKDFYDCEVIHLGKTGDGGIDLLLVNGNEQTAVQVKRRTKENSTESVTLIREFLGAMILEQKMNGIIVSTADHFTRPAKEAAKKAPEVSSVKAIELLDYSRFTDILKITTPLKKQTWEKYLTKTFYVEYYDDEDTSKIK